MLLQEGARLGRKTCKRLMKKQESDKGTELFVSLPFIPHNTHLPCEGGPSHLHLSGNWGNQTVGNTTLNLELGKQGVVPHPMAINQTLFIDALQRQSLGQEYMRQFTSLMGGSLFCWPISNPLLERTDVRVQGKKQKAREGLQRSSFVLTFHV